MRRPGLHIVIPAAALVLGAAYVGVPLFAVSTPSEFNFNGFGRLPVSYTGRFKPLDTVARNSLLIVSSRQSLQVSDRNLAPIEWMLDVIARPQVADQYEVFRIDQPGVRVVLGQQESKKKRFSFDTIMSRAEQLEHQIRLAELVPQTQRSHYQVKLLELADHLALYMSLRQLHRLHLVPPEDVQRDWLPLDAATAIAERSGEGLPVLRAYAMIFDAYLQQDAERFNREVAVLSVELDAGFPVVTAKASRETSFNRFAPFERAQALYFVAVMLILASWLVWHKPLRWTANTVWIFAWVVHTVGLVVRIHLSGRPPVTNLYSSAVFVGWGCGLLCLLMEALFKKGMGTVTGAAIGFLTLLVAAALAGDGDTMAVLQAVLDTNFWLATHVVVITLGYASTFLAGFLGIFFVLRGVLTQSLAKDEAKRMGQMIYGVVCFATLFSFVGTILGGIWADQSWGRFWGWDPKENGALIIVLWNALILHARWGGLVGVRGLAVLAIFGNVVTSWSWFGVNMLGAGLHSYGFIESAAFWLWIFVTSQMCLISIGLLPTQFWRSDLKTVVTLRSG